MLNPRQTPNMASPDAGGVFMLPPAFALGCRFGPFELDFRALELRRNGRRVRLQEKPLRLLMALAERPGEVVSRNELRERLWSHDTFVAFEDGLNTAVRKLREVLGDDPQNPRYIETVRGRGYRLVMELSAVPAQPETAEAAAGVAPLNGKNGWAGAAPVPAGEESREPYPGSPWRARRWVVPAAALLALAAVCAGAWRWLTRANPALSSASQGPVLIADFDNQTGDPRFDHALYTALTVSLEQSRRFNIYSRLQAGYVLRLMARNESDAITPAVGREICQRESLPGLVAPGITRVGDEYQLTAQLVDPATGNVVRSYAERVRGEDQILSATDTIATDIRRGLGESRLQIRESHRPLPEVTTPSLQALEAYADGSENFHRDRSYGAIRLYEAAIAADPGFAMAHAALGNVYFSYLMNEPALGEQEFQKALALSARTTPRERSLIEIQYAEGQERIADASALFRSYLKEYPGDWDARYSYARLLLMHGNAAESIPALGQLAQQAPDDPAVYVELATAFKDLGQFPPAIQSYEKAFSLDRSMLVAGDVNREYGLTLALNGQAEKARQVFSALLTGDSATAANGERSLAFLDLYQGKYASARQELMRALGRTDDPYSVARIRYMLAVVAAGQGNRGERIAELDQVLKNLGVLSRKVEYGALVGQAYARAGEVDKAKKILALIAPMVNNRSNEQVAYVQLLKAEVAAAGGDDKAALGLLKPPGESETESTAVLTREALAHIYQQMGNLDQATIWYTQFVQSGNRGTIGWEPQQQYFEGLYENAWDYRQLNSSRAAISSLNLLFALWKDADPDLPLLKQAKALRGQLNAAP